VGVRGYRGDGPREANEGHVQRRPAAAKKTPHTPAGALDLLLFLAPTTGLAGVYPFALPLRTLAAGALVIALGRFLPYQAFQSQTPTPL
jgi:hypothetical protein